MIARRFLLPTALALGLLGTAQAQPPGGPPSGSPPTQGTLPHDGPPGGGPAAMLRSLNLTPGQQAQIRAAFERNRPTMQALEERSHHNREALELAAPTDPNYPALLQTAKADAAARIDAMSAVRAQVYQILTPAQRATMAAKIREHHATMATEGWGRRPPPNLDGPPSGM